MLGFVILYWYDLNEILGNKKVETPASISDGITFWLISK